LLALALCAAACTEDDDGGGEAGTNRAPTISGTPSTSVAQNTSYAFTPTAADPDGDSLTFSIDAKPVWAVFDSASGRLTGTPSLADVGTYRGVTIRVSDGMAEAALPAFDLTVMSSGSTTRVGPNRAPTISGTPSGSVVAGSTYSFTPAANDVDRDSLAFTIRNRPVWATFSTSTGRLEGTPQVGHVGVYSNITIGVSDGQSAVQLKPFSIQVTAPVGNTPPKISGTPTTSVEAGSAYAFVPTATDAEGDSLTFNISGRPAWATFDGQTGRLAGTPSAAGTFGGIVISVSDGAASASLPAFTITVTAASGNAAPTISGTPPASATVGTQYVFRPTASDADGDALTFTIANRPSWATFNGGTGSLTGTPTASHIGTYGNVVISVSDGGAVASLPAFSITVNPEPNEAPTISGTPPTAVMAGNEYVFQPTASDPDGDVVSFSIVNKPAWASFSSSTGRLQGTPTAADVGTTSGIVVTVTDGELDRSLAAFSITVQSVATGSATLSWLPPTENADGSPLTNLAGYKVYWGTAQGNYPNVVTLGNPGLSSYVVESLVPGTYYFVTTAYTSTGVESAYSNVASKTIL
jgi:hypothetical protein